MSIENTEQANKALEIIGQKQRAIAVVAGRYNSQIAELKKRIENETEQERAEIERLENELKDFMESKADELFDKKKTVELVFGALSSRKTPARLELDSAESWDIVLENLQKHKMKKFILVKKCPDKTKIKKLMSLEEMKKAGVKKIQDVRFEYRTI